MNADIDPLRYEPDIKGDIFSEFYDGGKLGAKFPIIFFFDFWRVHCPPLGSVRFFVHEKLSTWYQGSGKGRVEQISKSLAHSNLELRIYQNLTKLSDYQKISVFSDPERIKMKYFNEYSKNVSANSKSDNFYFRNRLSIEKRIFKIKPSFCKKN